MYPIHVLGDVSFVCIKYNMEELPLLRYIKTLIDDYDSLPVILVIKFMMFQ